LRLRGAERATQAAEGKPKVKRAKKADKKPKKKLPRGF
jgi:hypothetical protein